VLVRVISWIVLYLGSKYVTITNSGSLKIKNQKFKIKNRQSDMLGPNQYVPQCVTDRRPLIMWSFVVIGVLIFVGLVVAAPLAQANGLQWLSFTVYETFSHFCHQSPERSFYIAGYPLAVCARCTGLYVGFAAAVAFYPAMTSLKRIR
jgi:hypothetical protein